MELGITGAHEPTGPPEPKPTVKLKELVDKAKNKAPLAKERPKPRPDKIMQIQQAYGEGSF
jgi:hypothetical protein